MKATLINDEGLPATVLGQGVLASRGVLSSCLVMVENEAEKHRPAAAAVVVAVVVAAAKAAKAAKAAGVVGGSGGGGSSSSSSGSSSSGSSSIVVVACCKALPETLLHGEAGHPIP